MEPPNYCADGFQMMLLSGRLGSEAPQVALRNESLRALAVATRPIATRVKPPWPTALGSVALLTLFARARPEPPLPLLGRERGVARLSDSSGEDVLAARIDAYPHSLTEVIVEPRRFAACKLLDGLYAEHREVPERRRPDRLQILEAPFPDDAGSRRKGPMRRAHRPNDHPPHVVTSIDARSVRSRKKRGIDRAPHDRGVGRQHEQRSHAVEDRIWTRQQLVVVTRPTRRLTSCRTGQT